MYRDFAEALKIAQEQKYITQEEATTLFKDFVKANKEE